MHDMTHHRSEPEGLFHGIDKCLKCKVRKRRRTKRLRERWRGWMRDRENEREMKRLKGRQRD